MFDTIKLFNFLFYFITFWKASEITLVSRDLLEWNGYEVADGAVVHHRTLVRPEDESDDGNWRENGSCEVNHPMFIV